MTKNITLAIDDEILKEARIVAAEERTTVNARVRDYLNRVVALRRVEVAGGRTAHPARDEQVSHSMESAHETVHQKMQRLLDEGNAKYADRKWFDHEETYDRDYQRAQGYFENRAALLKLIDETTADMGTQKWNREALYER